MNRGKTMRYLAAYALVIMLCMAWYSAPSRCLAAEDGRALAQQVYARDTGKDAYAKVEMVLINKQGNERPRTMLVAAKVYGKVSKRYIRFTEPASIAGVGFIAWENEDRA